LDQVGMGNRVESIPYGPKRYKIPPALPQTSTA
jgi:hypothetical protein